MSSIVPGPKQKLEQDITAARVGGKGLDARDLSPSAPPQEDLQGLDDWPETLRATVEAEHARVTALASNRRKTADGIVPEEVRGLDGLLDQVAGRLHAEKPPLFGKPSASQSDDLDDLAERLGIPDDALTVPGRGEHRTALRTIKQLRSQLKELETANDHSKLTRVATFVVRLALITECAPASTATLAPIALDRYAKSLPDYQWTLTFDQKLTFWKQTHERLTTAE
ncbi:hypothetical protein [Kribbella sp. NPDC004875]|uniref:hypothetical protein n=1 Tax=Kribbella sp. NPDC004875 TaxID=3364107 RepID=UPI003687A14E